MLILYTLIAAVSADGFVDTANTFAQVVGSLVSDAKKVQNKLADNYEPYAIGNEAADNPGAQKGILAGALNSVVLGVDDLPNTLNQIASCNPDDAKGLCCLMPNYCVSNAECSAEKLTGNPLDLLKAVPTCKCRKGFTGDGRSQGTGCVNINECETGEALCEDICEDRSPGYACGCSAGFVLNSNGYSCDDIDECALGTSACAHICTNTRGSYLCSCQSGYTLAEDGKNCDDVDECALMKEIIEFNAAAAKNSVTKPLSENAAAAIGDLTICEYPDLCVNLPGGYGCGCPAGFIANGGKCEDIDECSNGILEPDTGDLLLSPSDSPMNSICVSPEDGPTILSQQCLNLYGAFHCVCAPGFRIKGSSGYSENFAADLMALSLERTTVENADDQLDLYAKCVINALALECEDIDECTELDNPCATAKCINTKGSYKCLCDEGYEFRDGECRDIDECALMANGKPLPEGMIPCDVGETCVNQDGSYACKCAPGYKQVEGPKDGLSIKGLLPLKCEDINECLENNGGCVSGACENRSPGYVCRCPVGYIAGGEGNLQCIDINECELGFCSTGRKCVNLPGSYLCGGTNSQTLPTELTRWITQAEQLGRKIGSAASAADYTAAMVEWNNIASGLTMQKLTETLRPGLDNTALCSQLQKEFNLVSPDDICPGDSKCTPYGSDSFYCACPDGYQLSNDETVPTKSPISAMFSPSTIGGNLLGGLLGGTVGLLGGGSSRTRRLAAAGALPGAKAEGAAALLTTDELELSAELGVLSATEDGAPKLLVSPWVVREVKWDDYRLSGGFLPSTARCQDIDECTAGLRASGDISSLCNAKTPCCSNTPGSWTCVAKKRLGILGGLSCPTGTVDLQ